MAIELPKSTEFNKKIPKQKFYENLEISPALKKIFIEQVDKILWSYKIASSSTNLADGNLVKEIEVFEVSLKSPNLDDELLRHIDRAVPYHIVFILEYQGRYKACISYKEAATSGNRAFKVNSYYYTDWLDKQDLPLKLEGLNLDAAYENFVRQIAGETLQKMVSDESLKDSVARSEQKGLLQKQILALESKIRKEKQLNKQIQINNELKKLKRDLEEL
ncbi:DUF4391 domain-containing protein [Campylobacter concisus]|uniref:DUF4391 domain-containing protein n=1 Tax=Campylobacter concisus TaxID=199 RepID=A0AAE7P2K1_9BACT|nr:DUF4391 domain-containing protein [Campylobacter concisus]QPH85503.1 DUF4391 domain-containing protein [Campylobacter concisus]